MAQISRYPFIRQLRADASSHIQQYKNGKRVRSGRGLAFWFLPEGASISEIPIDDRELPIFLKGQSSDYQELSVQGTIMWRVTNPETLGDRVDFTIGLSTGALLNQPMDRISSVIINLARQYALDYLKKLNVRDALEAGVAPLQETILKGFEEDATLDEMGLEIVSVGIADLSPTSELSRALSAPTFESLQQQADEAGFARRAMAVEKERAIAENELNNKIELAARQQDLIEREINNARREAESNAELTNITTAAEAKRIRDIEQAKADMEAERVNVYANLPSDVLMALAAREFSGKLQKIDSITVTPDMLATLGQQFKTMMGQSEAPKPATTTRSKRQPAKRETRK